MKSIIFYVLILFVIFNVANAHFQLQAPPTRGFVDEKEPTAPCGSFDTVNTSQISNFPV
ncbi:11730_t:CDS:1, partial [Scutellospora calospora]